MSLLIRHPMPTSGTHKQQGKRKDGEGSTENAVRPNGLNHDFATPRVKSAAKSRKAVSLLNSIVDAKDDLLKEAIVSMDRSARNHLISKNNDFVKFVSVPLHSICCRGLPPSYCSNTIARVRCRDNNPPILSSGMASSVTVSVVIF